MSVWSSGLQSTKGSKMFEDVRRCSKIQRFEDVLNCFSSSKKCSCRLLIGQVVDSFWVSASTLHQCVFAHHTLFLQIAISDHISSSMYKHPSAKSWPFECHDFLENTPPFSGRGHPKATLNQRHSLSQTKGLTKSVQCAVYTCLPELDRKSFKQRLL